nr:8-oxoguanine deaminase [Candidatus Pantoea persica]
MTPAQYAEDLGWVGHDVWHAHCVKLDDHGIDLFAHTGAGVAHCPCSNMRLASGIAPVREMCDAGVHVGLGVDGPASNDSASIIGEVRQAMLLQRVGFGPDAMSARQALELAIFSLDRLRLAGAGHDPIAALVFCNPGAVAYSIINGNVVVRGRPAYTALSPQPTGCAAAKLIRQKQGECRVLKNKADYVCYC